ncbi:hypothetical protein KM043_013038 [Ampulex compressa]|nr:hypothetical protein KM043_013038 [Ampulex compressa]
MHEEREIQLRGPHAHIYLYAIRRRGGVRAFERCYLETKPSSQHCLGQTKQINRQPLLLPSSLIRSSFALHQTRISFQAAWASPLQVPSIGSTTFHDSPPLTSKPLFAPVPPNTGRTPRKLRSSSPPRLSPT